VRHNLEIPADQITGDELCPWHVVTIECECGHGHVVDHRLLKRGDRGKKPLSRLNWRCDWCHRTSTEARQIVRVMKLPRNV
jgi:lysyl-tRNA synthetase class I